MPYERTPPALNVAGILRAFSREQVRYAVVGGLAMVMHGSAYATRDMDILYARDPENIKRLVRALEDLAPVLRVGSQGDPTLPFRFDERTVWQGMNFSLATTAGAIDLFGTIEGIGMYDDAAPSLEPSELYGVPVLVLGLDGLIRAKEAAGRPKDQAVLAELRALREAQQQDRER